MADRLQQVGRDERWQLRTRQHVGGADARIVRPRNEDKVRVLGKGRRLRQQLRELPKVGGDRRAVRGGRRAAYAALIAEARRVQKEGLVVVTSGDWDYREIVLNWVLHAHRLQYSHALVIAMDEELYADLRPSP